MNKDRKPFNLTVTERINALSVVDRELKARANELGRLIETTEILPDDVAVIKAALSAKIQELKHPGSHGLIGVHDTLGSLGVALESLSDAYTGAGHADFIAFVGDTDSRELTRECVRVFREKAKLPSEGAAFPHSSKGPTGRITGRTGGRAIGP